MVRKLLSKIRSFKENILKTTKTDLLFTELSFFVNEPRITSKRQFGEKYFPPINCRFYIYPRQQNK